jgi:hypothetical protein
MLGNRGHHARVLLQMLLEIPEGAQRPEPL